MDPTNPNCLYDIFCTTSDSTENGISNIIATTAGGNWVKWDNLYRDMALESPLFSYRDPVQNISALTCKYRTGDIPPRKLQVWAITVTDTVRSIEHVLASLETKGPSLTRQGDLDIRLCLQFWCYTKKNQPTSRVKNIPLQLLWIIMSISEASRYPDPQAKFDMIIFACTMNWRRHQHNQYYWTLTMQWNYEVPARPSIFNNDKFLLPHNIPWKLFIREPPLNNLFLTRLFHLLHFLPFWKLVYGNYIIHQSSTPATKRGSHIRK